MLQPNPNHTTVTTLQDLAPIILSTVEQYLNDEQQQSLKILNSTTPNVFQSKVRALYLFGSQVYFAKVYPKSQMSSLPSQHYVLKLLSRNQQDIIEYNLTNSDLDIILVCDDLYSENFDEGGLTSNLQYKLTIYLNIIEEEMIILPNETLEHHHRYRILSSSVYDHLTQQQEEQLIATNSQHKQDPQVITPHTSFKLEIELSLLNTKYFLSFLNYHQPILLQFITSETNDDQFIIYEDSMMKYWRQHWSKYLMKIPRMKNSFVHELNFSMNKAFRFWNLYDSSVRNVEHSHSIMNSNNNILNNTTTTNTFTDHNHNKCNNDNNNNNNNTMSDHQDCNHTITNNNHSSSFLKKVKKNICHGYRLLRYAYQLIQYGSIQDYTESNSDFYEMVFHTSQHYTTWKEYEKTFQKLYNEYEEQFEKYVMI